MITVTLDHVHLRSPDPETAAAFYVETLGGTLADRIETAEMLRMVVAIGGTRLFIERVPESTPPGAARPHRGIEHIGFKVDDLEASASALKAAGVTFTVEPKRMAPHLAIAFLVGPDDVLIELLERKAA